MNPVYTLLFILPFGTGLFVYLYGAFVHSRRRGKACPRSRSFFGILGVVLAVVSVTGPLAHLAHADFRFHMGTHLILGMLSPLLIHLSRPLTLILCTLSVQNARRLVRFLKTRYVRTIHHPVTASLLNVGGMWVLYTTRLWEMMHQHAFLHLLIHLHIFLAGYVYTASLLQLEPSPDRYRFSFRAAVLVLSLAAHQILAKFIYARPPGEIPTGQAEAGGMMMYYGGDVIDLVIIIVLCRKGYQTLQPRKPLPARQALKP
ncbi:cytochrome c oxidase assembly protein [Thermoactinomyces sp. CICC 23799]|uniref:cytochrome c oxidase assembly protein n=1 Tax=Thermoactinomyces sp. CICC 23799 TaxID=2767429 RepID=UPI0018DE9AC0|nr:cytochrome c oxidase assembly protein [Thermoactinomyces sp. CICC 23799]MBH8601916.1 cytochrome c oxidase assembly protein [Thermoactinomyces sp. CICC 23799]